MAELNFDALREAVENDTYLPEFTEIRRRARRHRRWRLLVNTARILGVLVVAAPGLAIVDVVFTHVEAPAGSTTAAGPNDDDMNSVPLAASSSAVDGVTSSVVAVDGIDAAHTYALVDVCLVHACNMQLVQVNPPADVVPQSVGLIRTTPTEQLTGARLVLVNDTTAVVSALPAGGPRSQVSITIQPAVGKLPTAPRPVQSSVLGAIRVVTGPTGTPQSLPSQPTVSAPDLVSTIHGWWVTGMMPSGELGVSVSHDNGATWTVHSTGIRPLPVTAAVDGPNSAFATTDGTDMFVLARTAGGMKMLYSIDSGGSWHPITSTVLWPLSTSFTLVATPNGEVIASFTNGSTTTYVSSSNYGGTFHTMVGGPEQTGNMVRVGPELITVGTHSQVSTDGLNWQEALIPSVSPSDN